MISKRSYFKLICSLVFSLVFIQGIIVLKADTGKWPQDGSDLPVDSHVRWGELRNGFRYALLVNNEPPNEVSMRLLINAGSLMEEEDQRGLAHFLEHMAFNGTKLFSSGELIEYFQLMGMAMGADTNAHTGFDETVYKLDLPNGEAKTIADGLSVLRSFSDGMLLDPKDIEKERGIILSEKREGDTVDYRTALAQFQFYFDEILLPYRFPIGEGKVIEEANQERFKRFYKKWYIPQRIVLVVVGKIDLDAMEAAIEKEFADMEQGASVEEPFIGELDESQKLQVKLHSEKEATDLTVDIVKVRNFEKQKDTQALKKLRIMRWLAGAIVSKRLDILKNKEDAPFSSGDISFFNGFDIFEAADIQLITKPENWQRALQIAEEEIRRALKYGFTQSEVEEVKAKMLSAYEQSALEASTRKSRALASELLNDTHRDKVFTTPAFDYEFAKKLMPEITPELLWETFKDMWSRGKERIFITGNLELEDPEKEILDVYNASKKEKLEAPVEKKKPIFAYENFGVPGTVMKEFHDAELDVYQYVLSNNVRLNLKSIPYQANQIAVTVSFGRGALEAKKSQAALPFMTDRVFMAGGLKKHSLEDIDSIFAGKAFSLNFSVGADSFSFSGFSNRKDLRDLLGLTCAYFTAPGYREESLRNKHKELDQFYLSLQQTPEGVLKDKVARFLAGGDWRFGYASESEAKAVTLEEVRLFLEQPLSTSYLEISIVGDLDVQECLQTVLETVGALSKREASRPSLDERREVQFPMNTPLSVSFPVKSEIPKGIVMTVWPTDDGWDREQTRQLSVLSTVFANRLRVDLREALGKAYSTDAMSDESLVYKHYGTFSAFSYINPTQVEIVQETFLEIARKIVEEGITDDEFERAIKPILKEIDIIVRQITYWLTMVINNSQEYPIFLDWAKSFKKSYETMTKEDVQAVANKFLDAQKAIMVEALPEKVNTSVTFENIVPDSECTPVCRTDVFRWDRLKAGGE